MAALNIAFESPANVAVLTPMSSRPVDLVLLAAQTKGDKEREIEALQSFSRQARACLISFMDKNADTVRQAAQRLKNAAAQVGAARVGKAAETLERDGITAANLAQASAAILEAENFILKLCR